MISNGSTITNDVDGPQPVHDKQCIRQPDDYSIYKKLDRSKLTGFEALNFQPLAVSPMLQWLNNNWRRK
jgi:hypothetical protein